METSPEDFQTVKMSGQVPVRLNAGGHVERTTMTQEPLSLADKPGMSPANRSLERGIEILRAFRPGSDLLGNGELADRTGLSRPTVSRLTQTLVGMGMLQQEPSRKGYRLAPAVLSLAHAMRSGSWVLQVAAPLMRSLAQSRQINVGLAAPDRDEMVYLESIRYSRRAAFRNVVSGQRVPMELTSLGRAYLASTSDVRRKALLGLFRQRRGSQWPALAREIERAIADVHEKGYCAASWQAEVVALATPLPTAEAYYSLNVSVSTTDTMDQVVDKLSTPLLSLKADILRVITETKAY
jgi:DNA-binding IclR family transcriptional regulator